VEFANLNNDSFNITKETNFDNLASYPIVF